jgi:hypothetical protein
MGEHAEVCQAFKMAEKTASGLFDAAADAEWQWELSKRGHRSGWRRSPSCRPGALSYALPSSVLCR